GAERRGEVRCRMAVGEVEADRRALVEREIAVHEGWDQPVRVEAEILRRLVRIVLAVDEAQLERLADLFERHVRRHAGVAREIVQRNHGFVLSLWFGRYVLAGALVGRERRMIDIAAACRRTPAKANARGRGQA